VIRVLIAAPSAILRAGLESIVRSSPALELAGSAADLANLEAAAEREQPDVVLADVEFAPGEGPPAGLASAAAVVLLVDHPAGQWTLEALRSGVRAVLPRDISAGEMIAAIEAVAAGLAVLSPADLQALLPAAPRAERADSTTGGALTPREREVLALLAEGVGNKTIAWKLAISEHTVKFHVASIMGKLNATSRTEAVAVGIRKGLILL
jgi:two-component system, NarL family, response regulator YdfI